MVWRLYLPIPSNFLQFNENLGKKQETRNKNLLKKQENSKFQIKNNVQRMLPQNSI
jgi:hypothetical protein